MFSLSTQQAVAAPPEKSQEIMEHLEFMGYEVSANTKKIKAQHNEHLNINIKKYRGGMLITAYFGGSDYAKKNLPEFYKTLNKLNKQAASARYYIDSDTDLVLEAYYPGEYNKKNFSAFINAFNLERDFLSEMGESVTKFID